MLTLSVRVLRHTALVFLSVGPVRFVVNPIRVRICFSKDVPLSVPSVADRHFLLRSCPSRSAPRGHFLLQSCPSKSAPRGHFLLQSCPSKSAPRLGSALYIQTLNVVLGANAGVNIFYSKAAPRNLLRGSAPHYAFQL